MEDYALDVMIGKGPSARSLRLTLKPFTVVGATTRAGRISSPLRDRFGATYRLDFYEEPDLTEIVERSARILGVSIEPAAARAIARRGRGTPRIVNRLLKRVRDHAEVHGDGTVDEATALAAMKALEIDDEGLDSTDRKLLAAIIQKFGSGPGGRRRARRRSCPRRSRRSRTSTSRSSCGSASSIGRRRAGSRPMLPVLTSRGSATRSRRRGAGSPTWSGCGRLAASTPGDDRPRTGRPGPLTWPERRVSRSSSRRRRDGSTRARLGRLELTHGAVDTPQFMPVGTNATVKALDPDDLVEAGASIILANTYHLYLRPGHERIERLGGLHRFMGVGSADPHRFGRLPGRLARRPSRRHRRWRDVPKPSRRLAPSIHAGARDRRPGGARLGRRGRA